MNNQTPAIPTVFDHKTKGRSRLTNHGSRMRLPDLDGRHRYARRFRDIAAALSVDQGGWDQMSEMRKQLTRRAGGAAVLCEMREAAAARGEPVDITRHVVLGNLLVKISKALGLDARVIEAYTQTKEDVIAEIQAAKAARAAAEAAAAVGGGS